MLVEVLLFHSRCMRVEWSLFFASAVGPVVLSTLTRLFNTVGSPFQRMLFCYSALSSGVLGSILGIDHRRGFLIENISSSD